jgi:hypothetical protein
MDKDILNITIVTSICIAPLIIYLIYSISRHKGCHFHKWEKIKEPHFGKIIQKCKKCGIKRENIQGYWHYKNEI